MRVPRSVLRVRASVEPWLGNTGDGDSYGTAASELVGWDPTERIIHDAHGQALVASGTLTLAPSSPIKPKDRVTIAGTAYRVASVDAAPSPGGGVHHKLAAVLP